MENDDGSNEGGSNNEVTFEDNINELSKQVQEYDAMTNDEKIQNIDQYNAIINNISQYEEQLEEYKIRLNNIESLKSQKKKANYTKKNFISDMNSIVDIRNIIDSSRNIDISILMELYEKLSDIQKRIIPHLETKKLEIIKL